MAWLSIDEDNNIEVGVDKAFSIIQEGPPTLATRQIKQSRDVKAEAAVFEQAEKKLKLSSYPELYNGEPTASRLKRAAAFDQCWTHLSQQMQVGCCRFCFWLFFV